MEESKPIMTPDAQAELDKNLAEQKRQKAEFEESQEKFTEAEKQIVSETIDEVVKNPETSKDFQLTEEQAKIVQQTTIEQVNNIPEVANIIQKNTDTVVAKIEKRQKGLGKMSSEWIGRSIAILTMMAGMGGATFLGGKQEIKPVRHIFQEDRKEHEKKLEERGAALTKSEYLEMKEEYNKINAQYLSYGEQNPYTYLFNAGNVQSLKDRLEGLTIILGAAEEAHPEWKE